MPITATRRASMSWAQRLKRVFPIDIEPCAPCGGALRVIACIEDSLVIDQILTHLVKKAAGGVGAKPGAIATESVRLLFRPTPPRFEKRQPLGARQGPDLLADWVATLKPMCFLGKTLYRKSNRRECAVQTLFHSAIEHHFSVFDISRLWGKGRLCFLYARWAPLAMSPFRPNWRLTSISAGLDPPSEPEPRS